MIFFLIQLGDCWGRVFWKSWNYSWTIVISEKNKVKKRSKEEKREEKEEKKGRKIPLRNYTKGGRKSSVIAGVNILLFILAVVISILKKGNAGIYVGLLMLLVMVSAIAGFVIGINSFKEENKFLKYTYIGTITNAVIWIFILGMYLAYV